MGNKQGTPDPAVTDYSGVLSAGQLENLQKLLSGKSPAEGGYHTSKLRLFITKKGDTEATAQSDEINNYQPAEGEICTWVELEEWKPKIKMVKYGSPKQESDFAKLLHDLGLTTESFWRDFPDDWGTSVLNNFSIGLYTLMDWISHGIGKAAIPEYVWNCHVKTGYRDIYARTFNFLLDPFSLTPTADYVVVPFMNQYGSQFGKDLQYARFAYTCGLWNGLVQTVQSIPEGIKLLTNLGTKEPVKEWAAIKTEVAKACGNPNGNMCFVGFLKVAWNGISSMHDITKPCLFGYAMGNDVFLIISIYFTGGTGAVVSTSGRVLSTFLNVLNKLDVMGQIIGRATGATIKVVMMSGGKYAVSIVTKAGIEIFKVVEEKGVKSIYYVKAGVQTLIDWNNATAYKLITSNGVQYKVCVGELLNNNLEKANLRIKQYLRDADGNLIKNEQGDGLAIVGKEGSEAEADNAVAVVKKGEADGLIGIGGNFIDEALESDYQKYSSRKATQGKPPRERLEWKEARDYWLFDSPMARGNAFDKKAVDDNWYNVNELSLANGKRLDSYVPPNNKNVGEIISRKATSLEDIEISTFETYLKEMKSKYAAGTTIRSNQYPLLDGQILQGKQILEIPSSNQSFSQVQDYIDLAKNKYNIEIRFKPE